MRKSYPTGFRHDKEIDTVPGIVISKRLIIPTKGH